MCFNLYQTVVKLFCSGHRSFGKLTMQNLTSSYSHDNVRLISKYCFCPKLLLSIYYLPISVLPMFSDLRFCHSFWNCIKFFKGFKLLLSKFGQTVLLLWSKARNTTFYVYYLNPVYKRYFVSHVFLKSGRHNLARTRTERSVH